MKSPQTVIVVRLCFFLLLLTALSVQAAEVNKTLKLVSGHWPPYVEKDAPGGGAAIDLVSRILKRAGYDTVASIDSWPRSLQGSAIGIYDVLATAWFTKDRDRELQFSEPYYENVTRFIKRKDSPVRFRSYADLKNLMVGVVTGRDYGEKFDQAQGFLRIAKSHVIENLLLMQQRRIDLTLGDEWVIRHELTQYFPNAVNEFEFLPQPVSKRGLHIAVSRTRPDHKEIIHAFNKALAAMRADGSMQKLLDRYRAELVHLGSTEHRPLQDTGGNKD
ncbi:hypothetical protein MNBD_GAMMA24-1173 [hydrothermal vent metagenome]|uniref:Solute-binding protein family 3/N-terminal domain-containing protein n=1 Tax=hydrothermal vent metagenome TaxID=652676 RepID=A0A3B1B4L9_9ZZZZ